MQFISANASSLVQSIVILSGTEGNERRSARYDLEVMNRTVEDQQGSKRHFDAARTGRYWQILLKTSRRFPGLKSTRRRLKS